MLRDAALKDMHSSFFQMILNILDFVHLQVNGQSLEYVTHDDAVAAIASSIEQSNQIVLRVAKVNQYYSPKVNQVSTVSSNAGLNISQNGSTVDILAK